MRPALLALMFALPAAPAFAQPAAAGPQTFVVKAARIVTDAAQPAMGPGMVVVTGGRIVSVGPVGPTPAGARVIDLGSATLLPGLIDAHVHLTGDPGTPYEREAIDTDEYAVAVGLKNALVTVRAGFTTVADLGSARNTGFAIRSAIRNGIAFGPRVLASGPAISIPGGHGDVNGFREEVNHALDAGNTCTGAEACAARVREASKRGADLIKITATGGVLSQQGRGLEGHFTPAEMAAITGTAKRLGLHVAAHAHGSGGIAESVEAGVRSVEHGSFIDAAGIAAMKRTGAFYVPTLMALQGVSERVGKGIYTPTVDRKAREALAVWGRGLNAAHKAGVRIAFGTDAGVMEHGRNAGEFRLMVEKGGMTQRAALVAATTGAAELLGLSNETGRIAPGLSADLLAVDGDPQADADTLMKPRFVMAAGRVIPLQD